jgi:hypothetical protein
MFVDGMWFQEAMHSAGSRQTSECWVTKRRKTSMDWAVLKPWWKNNDRETGVWQ